VIKSYETVTVNYMVGPSGRSAVEGDFGAKKEDERKLPREIVSTIRNIPDDEAVIVFTFKQRGRRKDAVDVPALLRRDLERAGIDLSATMPNGKSRLVILKRH
jgi:c-di-GMP-binding flagellar brake protein YcgR